MQLTTTREQILQAAQDAPESKATLMALFPEAFDEQYLQLNRCSVSKVLGEWFLDHEGKALLGAAVEVGFSGFVLSTSFDWHLIKTSVGLVLLPMHKPR